MKPLKFSKKKREYIKWGANVTEVRTFGSAPAQVKSSVPEFTADGKTADGVYANLAAISHAADEIIMDFIFVRPGLAGGRAGTRVIANPVQAKRLVSVLKKELKRYEDRFGPVKA